MTRKEKSRLRVRKAVKVMDKDLQPSVHDSYSTLVPNTDLDFFFSLTQEEWRKVHVRLNRRLLEKGLMKFFHTTTPKRPVSDVWKTDAWQTLADDLRKAKAMRRVSRLSGASGDRKFGLPDQPVVVTNAAWPCADHKIEWWDVPLAGEDK